MPKQYYCKIFKTELSVFHRTQELMDSVPNFKKDYIQKYFRTYYAVFIRMDMAKIIQNNGIWKRGCPAKRHKLNFKLLPKPPSTEVLVAYSTKGSAKDTMNSYLCIYVMKEVNYEVLSIELCSIYINELCINSAHEQPWNC